MQSPKTQNEKGWELRIYFKFKFLINVDPRYDASLGKGVQGFEIDVN